MERKGQKRMLTISIISRLDNINIDIRVNSRQKISNTIEVLQDAGMLKSEKQISAIRSKRSKRRIDINSSYQDSKIYNGDTLLLEYTNENE